MAASEDGGEHLLDDFVLADDDLLQFLLHQLAMLAELHKDFAQVAMGCLVLNACPCWLASGFVAQ